MRIGIDGSCLANRRGFGRFARETVAALDRTPGGHDYVVFIDRPSEAIARPYVPDRFAPRPSSTSARHPPARRPPGTSAGPDMLAMGRAVAGAGRPDLFSRLL